MARRAESTADLPHSVKGLFFPPQIFKPTTASVKVLKYRFLLPSLNMIATQPNIS